MTRPQGHERSHKHQGTYGLPHQHVVMSLERPRLSSSFLLILRPRKSHEEEPAQAASGGQYRRYAALASQAATRSALWASGFRHTRVQGHL